MAHDELSERGMDMAVSALTSRGYEILDRTWTCPDGTIDLVARDGRNLVFIEVKTRSGTTFGHPFEAITPGKLSRLRRLAAEWQREKGTVKDVDRLRVDAIAVILPSDGQPTFEHLQGIF